MAEPVQERFRNCPLPVWANGLDEGWFGEDYERLFVVLLAVLLLLYLNLDQIYMNPWCLVHEFSDCHYISDHYLLKDQQGERVTSTLK